MFVSPFASPPLYYVIFPPTYIPRDLPSFSMIAPYQSHRSLTSWLVILLGQEVTFTWWGLVSGLFWVPGGAFNIFAIRNAGLAISQGIVASSIVVVSLLSLPIVART